jgi:hypothetical protein
MANESSAAIQINFKTKRDGMLINLRANDALELDMLIDALSQRLATLIDLEQTTETMAAPQAPAQSPAQVIANAFPNAQVVTEAPNWTAAPAAPAGYTPSRPVPECTCGGGAMRHVPAGIAKSTGRPYKAFYACPKPQGQACQNKVPA